MAITGVVRVATRWPPSLAVHEIPRRRLHTRNLRALFGVWRGGRDNKTMSGKWDQTRPDRFWAKVNKRGPAPKFAPELGACWLWTHSVTHRGYGRLAIGGGKSGGAHRYAYELLVGPIADGLVIDHLCRVSHCVNPAHLEAVETSVNVSRGMAGALRRIHQTHCKWGHPFDEANTAFSDGRRRCRACCNNRTKRRWAARAGRSQ